MTEVKAGVGLLAWSGASMGPHAAWEEGLYRGARISWNVSATGEILDLPQLLGGNLWLGSSVSAEPEPKSLWFPGVTTTFCSEKVNQIVLALSARTTSGLH